MSATANCGSDLHLYGGLMPTMESGDVLGHDLEAGWGGQQVQARRPCRGPLHHFVRFLLLLPEGIVLPARYLNPQHGA